MLFSTLAMGQVGHKHFARSRNAHAS
jgi:hypothetical protein